MKAAEQTDVMIAAKVTENETGMNLLNKSRGEIAAMIPTGNGQGDISSNPIVVTLKELLDQLEQFKKQKEATMQEVCQINDNLNCTDDLMKVNNGEMQKQECFDKYQDQYRAIIAKNEAIEQEKATIMQKI